jgi:hypothetical protein
VEVGDHLHVFFVWKIDHPNVYSVVLRLIKRSSETATPIKSTLITFIYGCMITFFFMGARSVGPKQRLSRFWNICAQKKVFLSFPWVQVICDYVKIWSSSSHIKVHQQISFCHFGNLQSSWENQILLWHDQGLKFWSIYQNSTDWIGSEFAILTSFCWFHPNSPRNR